MSSSTEKRPLAQAEADANDFVKLFEDTYEKFVVAGSIRRRKPMVGDCEFVVIPKFGDVKVPNTLFWEHGNLVWDRLDSLLRQKVVERHVYGDGRGRWGEKQRSITFRWLVFELFTADSHNFGEILTIRTGSADFSRNFVTKLKSDGIFRQVDGNLVRVATGEIMACPDEETYFRYAGLPFVEPECRE